MIEYGAIGCSSRKIFVLGSGWVALGLCLILILSAPFLAASSSDTSGRDRHPLRPADTTSPQATLRSFQENAREIVRLVRARRPPAEVDRAVLKLLDTLDLSSLPSSDWLDQGAERAAMLLEILGRIELPPPAEIPDAAAVEASGLTRWTIPNTRIAVARTEEGPHAGDFQFTAETVQQIPVFYEYVKHLPPRQGALAGFYDEWSHGPGPWVPSGWTENLPAFTYVVIWRQTVWQWLAAFATIGLTLVVILFAYHLARRLDRTLGSDAHPSHFARLGAAIVAIALLELAIRCLDDAVNLTGQRLFLVNGVLRVTRYGAIGTDFEAVRLIAKSRSK